MTPSPQAVLRVIDILNDSGAPYIVTRSMATNIYCVPRSSLDGDFVVEMKPDELEHFFERLEPEFEREPQLAFETVTGKVQHKFRVRGSTFMIEIFEAHMDDPHERARFERRREGDVEGRIGFVPTAEDVVVQKLRWFKRIHRPKDAADAQNVLLHQWTRLDWKYIERWCREHGSLELLDSFKHDVALKRQAAGLAD